MIRITYNILTQTVVAEIPPEDIAALPKEIVSQAIDGLIDRIKSLNPLRKEPEPAK